jgi:hypothetical protein
MKRVPRAAVGSDEEPAAARRALNAACGEDSNPQ